MKEVSSLFDYHAFQRLFTWLAENPEAKVRDWLGWSVLSEEYDREDELVFPCMCAKTLANSQNSVLLPRYHQVKKLVDASYKRRPIFDCAYCPLEWPLPMRSYGFALVEQWHNVGVRATFQIYKPCKARSSFLPFLKGLYLKYSNEESLEKRSKLAMEIAGLPLSDVGQRIVERGLSDPEEVLHTYYVIPDD